MNLKSLWDEDEHEATKSCLLKGKKILTERDIAWILNREKKQIEIMQKGLVTMQQRLEVTKKTLAVCSTRLSDLSDCEEQELDQEQWDPTDL